MPNCQRNSCWRVAFSTNLDFRAQQRKTRPPTSCKQCAHRITACIHFICSTFSWEIFTKKAIKRRLYSNHDNIITHSHGGTVGRECSKYDDQSRWVTAKFGSPATPKPLKRSSQKNCLGDSVPDIYNPAKGYPDRIKG